MTLAAMPIQPRKAEVLIGLARNQSEVARQNSIDGGALRGSSWGCASDEALRVGIDDAGAADAGYDRKIAAAEIGIHEVEQLVPDQRSAYAGAGLVPDLGGIECRVTVARVQGAVAEEPVSRSVHAVAAGPSDGV